MNKIVIAAGLLTLALTGLVVAQQPGFTRTPVQSQNLSAPGRVAVQVRAEFDPGAVAGRHTHPGEELGYVLEGQLELRIEGQPPRVVKAGEAFFEPAGVIHDATNTGSGKAVSALRYHVHSDR